MAGPPDPIPSPGGAVLDRRVSRRVLLRYLALSAASGAVVAACEALAPGSARPLLSDAAPSATPPATPVPTIRPTPGPPTATPESTPEPSAEPTPPPRGGVIRTGVLAASVQQGWLTWRPGGQEAVWNWCAQRLLSVDPDGRVVYDLAASHSVSDDGLRYTFVLADGATWHDGRPVTASDVAFTYNTALKATAGSTITTLLAGITGISEVLADNSRNADGIQVVDERTIRFVLERANAQVLPSLFATLWITPRHPFADLPPDRYMDHAIATGLFIGSGPYRMVEFDSRQHVRLEAFDDYANGSGWTGRPRADSVLIRLYEDAVAQLTSTQVGEVDFQLFPRPSVDTLRQLMAIRDMSAQRSLVGYNHFYSFNLNAPSSPLILDRRFRQATVWALDRQRLVDEAMGGAFRVPEVMNHWTAPWAVSDALERYHPWDPQQAKDLLLEIGWPADHVVRVHHYPPVAGPDLALIVQMWEAVGIRSQLTPIPDAEFVRIFFADTDLATPGDQGPGFDIAFAYTFGTLDGSPWSSDSTLGSSRVYPNGSNSMRWKSEEWDANFADALRQPTREQQAPFFRRCSEIFNEELPYVPLYQRVDYAMVGHRLRGPEKARILNPAAGGVRHWEWYIAPD